MSEAPAPTPTPNPAPAAGGAAAPAVVPGIAAPVVPTPAPVVEYKFDKVDGIPDALGTEVARIAKGMGLDAEAAKKLHALTVEDYKAETAEDAKALEADKAAYAQKIAQEDAEWDKAFATKHPEWVGAKAPETEIKLQAFIARFDKGGEFSKLVADNPRLIKHPAFRSMIAAAGYAMGESNFVQGSTEAKPKSDLELFYGKKSG